VFCELYMSIGVWILSIHVDFCDPNMDIAFEEEKPNAYFVNSMGYCSLNTFNPYQFLWPQCGYCIWGRKTQWLFYELYMLL
jgi:hypothetical protein